MRTGVWNKAPLTCPMCGRHFAAFTIRILKHDNHWACQACVDKATNAPPPTRAMTLEQHQDLAHQRCATCHQPFGDRRTTVNIHGALVHFHCPQKAHPNRRNRRARAG